MRSKAPLLLMEQMIMLLVFALAAALCLQAFVQSDAASRESEARDRAANLCQSMAEVLRTNGGDPYQAADTVLGGGWQSAAGMFRVPLNENMTPAGDADVSYWLEVGELSHKAPGLDAVNIHVRTYDVAEVFSLEVCWQVEVTQ